MSGSAAPPDLSRAPNFEALGAWFEKLNTWCQAAVNEITRLKGRIDELVRSEVEAEHKRGLAEDRVESLERLGQDLLGFIEDVERGVRSGPELFEYIQREALHVQFSSQPPNEET